MILDYITPAELDAALAAARRVERDRLARILHAHGLARIARDVECLDVCPDCDGRRPRVAVSPLGVALSGTF